MAGVRVTVRRHVNPGGTKVVKVREGGSRTQVCCCGGHFNILYPNLCILRL